MNGPQKPYEKPPPKQQFRQSAMPFFMTVEGEFTQFCVKAAQNQPCPNPKCSLSHEPKERRMCPMFHNPREKCPHNPCLLGHHEAREAFRASKALARCKRLTEYKDDTGPTEPKVTADVEVEKIENPGANPQPQPTVISNAPLRFWSPMLRSLNNHRASRSCKQQLQ